MRQAPVSPTPLPGATVQRDGTVDFAIWAPSVPSLVLELDGAALPMRPGPDGWFTASAAARPGTPYKFRTPAGMAFPDPASRAQQGDVHDASIVVDHGGYVWRHRNWRNRPWHEAVIYEAHPGLMGGFAGLRARLAEIAATGFTAVELMPVADFPGRHNWGYDGVLPYAPDAAYGTPDELRALVDDAHGLGLMVLLDVVYNHFGPDGAYIHAVAKPFFDEGVHTPWGAAIDFRRPEVAGFFIANALMWLRDYRFDGLRFDAVHAINPPEFLPRLARAIRAGIERPVHLVLENEDNRASLLRAAPDAAGFDAQWADDFHHCLHVLLTGEREGYYEDFQDPARQLVRVLSEGFAYQGETPPKYGKPRGEPSGHLPPTAFVVCLQNHDQIGNRAMGERLTALADPAALRAARALMLLAPFIPLLFMGEEWGTRTPFLFFTDHNDELAGLVREGRRREFAHFSAFQDEAKRALIPDPNAPATFAASRPDPAEGARPGHAAILRETRALLDLRAAHVVPGIPGARSAGAELLGDRAVRARWRLGHGRLLTLEANFGAAPITVEHPAGKMIYSTGSGGDPGTLGALTTRAFLD
jgi:maltooligosyltrehalose trehalohydrolase